MLIHEKALARELKTAWKNGGYRVVVREDYLYIISSAWAAVISADDTPRHILGLLAEHIGNLPGDQAMLIRKDTDNQMVMQQDMDQLLEQIRRTDRETATPTQLIWKSRWRLYQKPDHSISGLDTELLGILQHQGDKPPLITSTGGGAKWQDHDSTVVIMCMSRKDNVHLDYLEQFDWRIDEEGQAKPAQRDETPPQLSWMEEKDDEEG
ncbi:MAG: hypothetical protein ACERKO_10595 [Acetanaerobacterium sp.]